MAKKRLIMIPKNRPVRKDTIAAVVKYSAPIEMLSNFETIVQTEIMRLKNLSANEALSGSETKRLALLMDTFTKYNKELRESKKQSVLDGLSYDEIVNVAKEAMEVLQSQSVIDVEYEPEDLPDVIVYDEDDEDGD